MDKKEVTRSKDGIGRILGHLFVLVVKLPVDYCYPTYTGKICKSLLGLSGIKVYKPNVSDSRVHSL